MTPICTTITSNKRNCSLTREPRPLPTLRIDPSVQSIFDFQYEHFRLENYNPHPHIAAPVAV